MEMNYLTLRPLLMEVEGPGARITFLTTTNRQTLSNKDSLVTRNVSLFVRLQTHPMLLLPIELFFPIFIQNLHSFSSFIFFIIFYFNNILLTILFFSHAEVKTKT